MGFTSFVSKILCLYIGINRFEFKINQSINQDHMNQSESYSRLKQLMDHHDLKNFDNSYKKAAHFYFELLQKLYVEKLCIKTENEKTKQRIEELKHRIHFQQEKQKNFQKQKQAKMIAGKPYVCLQYDCECAFTDERNLYYHQIIKHKNPLFYQDPEAVFEISLIQDFKKQQQNGNSGENRTKYDKTEK